VVHTSAGHEKKVKSHLESRIASMKMEEKIFEVAIPVEDLVEYKGPRGRSSRGRSSPAM
jgi:transcriptional antiterminator NusG